MKRNRKRIKIRISSKMTVNFCISYYLSERTCYWHNSSLYGDEETKTYSILSKMTGSVHIIKESGPWTIFPDIY